MIVYHGTTLEIQHPDITHSKRFLDFGIGFYVTSFPEQAKRWALRKGMRFRTKSIVNVYDMADLSAYHVKRFRGADDEWLKFVCECRRGHDIYKEFDAVIGCVADDDVFKCVSMYMDGLWDEARTLHEIRFYKKNDQIAFLNQNIIDSSLKFLKCYEVRP